MRSQVLQGMMAAQETTAVLISNTMFLLARHTEYWGQLRKEVLERGESLFALDNLSNFEFLQRIITECKLKVVCRSESKMLIRISSSLVPYLRNYESHCLPRYDSAGWRRTEPKSAGTHREGYYSPDQLLCAPSQSVGIWTKR